MKPEELSKLSGSLEEYNKSLLDKLNEQTKATNKVYDELKKFNERIDKDKQEQEQLENQEKKQNSDEILEELKNLSKLTEENGKKTETDEKIEKIVSKVEKDYDLYHMQANVITFYGVIVIPGLLLFFFIYHLLKQFIF